MISFQLSEEEKAEQNGLYGLGRVGHPTGSFYFCNEHLAIAEKYRHLSWQRAIDAITDECKKPLTQDKSSYSNPNKPKISEGLQNFITAMVEEIVVKGKPFDEQKKKWLKKYSEAEELNYDELEGNLNDFLELIEDYHKSQSNALKRVLLNQASVCFIGNNLLDKLISQQPQIILPQGKKSIIPDTQFKTVEIGNQIWMAENLNVDRFRNGDPIPEAKTNEEWQRAGENKQPAWCYLDNDPANGDKYGKMYNFYAVNDKRIITPYGCNVPTYLDYSILIENLGGKDIAGKEILQLLLIKFAGNRDSWGNFLGKDHNVVLWTSTEYDSEDAGYLYIGSNINEIHIDLNLRSPKSQGYYLRCIKY